jgi:ubiquinol-cytochrome c reductase iron-sulfur subunit
VRRWLWAAVVLLLGKMRRKPVGLTGPRWYASRTAEDTVLVLLFSGMLAAAAFIALYATDADTQLLGLALGAAFILVAAALAVAAKAVVPEVEAEEPRPELWHEQEQEEALDRVEEGVEGLSRRRLFVVAGAGTAAFLGAALLTPALSCGPEADRVLTRSPWRRGRRLMTEGDEPIAASSIVVGELVTAFPEGAEKDELASPLAVVRVRPDELELPDGRRGWATPEGVVAYSKICTHAGCAVAEYRYPAYEPTSPGPPALVCPCHYSTFSVIDGGNRIFGPAGRPLPQLPLAVDGDGNLVAAGDFSGRVGPSWWGVRK